MCARARYEQHGEVVKSALILEPQPTEDPLPLPAELLPKLKKKKCFQQDLGKTNRPKTNMQNVLDRNITDELPQKQMTFQK